MMNPRHVAATSLRPGLVASKAMEASGGRGGGGGGGEIQLGVSSIKHVPGSGRRRRRKVRKGRQARPVRYVIRWNKAQAQSQSVHGRSSNMGVWAREASELGSKVMVRQVR